MTLVNTRAAFEDVISTNVRNADPSVIIIFDNMPFIVPGLNNKYVMVTIDFDQSTRQPQGDSVDFYAGSIRCAIMTPTNRGSASASLISQAVIDGLTSINASSYVDTFSVSPKIGPINGPTVLVEPNQRHFTSVINCDFTAKP